MKKSETDRLAQEAAATIQQKLEIHQDQSPQIGLVLGTGWGDVLPITQERSLRFQELPGFEELGELEGHARRVVYGSVADIPIIALRGRVHLNESFTMPTAPRMVRQQIEMLLELGVRTFILTAAVGGLKKKEVGEVAVIDRVITIFAPTSDFPLHAGEFCSPEDVLDKNLFKYAILARGSAGLKGAMGDTHVMVRGPFFEGRACDKDLLASSGAGVVGMSILPELCVISTRKDTRAVALGFVTNTAKEIHSHEENQRRAKECSAGLGTMLTQLVTHIKS